MTSKSNFSPHHYGLNLSLLRFIHIKCSGPSEIIIPQTMILRPPPNFFTGNLKRLSAQSSSSYFLTQCFPDFYGPRLDSSVNMTLLKKAILLNLSSSISTDIFAPVYSPIHFFQPQLSFL